MRTARPAMQTLMNAWADGLNYFLATHPEVKPRVLKRFEPWMALSFTEGSIGGDIERIDLDALRDFYSSASRAALSAGNARRHSSPCSIKENARLKRHRHRAGTDRDGHALLLINPHTSHYFRSELQVTSDEGLNVYGAATWGQFFIYQGFNAHAGWMHTSSGVDNVDEFAEVVERQGKACCYRYGSSCNAVGVRPVTIRYRTAIGEASRSQTSPPISPTTARSSVPRTGAGSPSR